MDLVVVTILFCGSLLFSVKLGIALYYPLLLGLACFVLIALRRGYKIRDLGKMILDGAKKSVGILKLFALIGAITAVWRACGTVAFIVYYGVAFMDGDYFIISAFILCCIVSFLLGTSFGTVGTLGIVLIVLAKSGGIDVNIAAGAIISGAYFGDRCSPVSATANLVATLTNTELYINVKNMMKTSVFPFLLTSIGYICLSYLHPLMFHSNQMGEALLQAFNIDSIVLLPAAVILIGAAFKTNVRLLMSISILSGVLIGIFVQQKTFFEMMKYIIIGYSMDGNELLADIIKGGGLYSMLHVALVLLICSTYAGIFDGTGLLSAVEQFFERISRKIGVFSGMIMASIASASFGFNQVFATMLAHQFENEIYHEQGLNKYRLALDLENTVILISAMIPWNIAAAFPAATLSVDSGFIPYAFYLFLIPLINLLTRNIKIDTK